MSSHARSGPGDPRKALRRKQFDQLGLAAGSLPKPPAKDAGDLPHIDTYQRLALDPQPPVLPERPDPGDEHRIVTRRDHVDRRPHQCPLDHPAPFECHGQLTSFESLQPRPQADVPRGGVLGLETADLFQGPRQGIPRPLQEQLTGQQSPIQGPDRQDAARHAERLALASRRLRLRGSSVRSFDPGRGWRPFAMAARMPPVTPPVPPIP
jgi:hypothetical protein